MPEPAVEFCVTSRHRSFQIPTLCLKRVLTESQPNSAKQNASSVSVRGPLETALKHQTLGPLEPVVLHKQQNTIRPSNASNAGQ